MDKIREWSFPVMLLTAWMGVAAYTLCSLGQAQARVAAAQKPAVVAPFPENTAVVISKQVSSVRKAQKASAHRGPRA
jgi:uncharacterized membrane protein